MQRQCLIILSGVVLGSFILLLLTGEVFLGSYFFYYEAGLFNGISYSVIGITGVVLLITALMITTSRKTYLQAILSMSGSILLTVSLIDFYSRSRLHQDISVLQQVVPSICLSMFILSVFFVILYSIILIIRRLDNKSSPLSATALRSV